MHDQMRQRLKITFFNSFDDGIVCAYCIKTRGLAFRPANLQFQGITHDRSLRNKWMQRNPRL